MNSRKELGNQALKMAKESSRNKIGTPIVGVPQTVDKMTTEGDDRGRFFDKKYKNE